MQSSPQKQTDIFFLVCVELFIASFVVFRTSLSRIMIRFLQIIHGRRWERCASTSCPVTSREWMGVRFLPWSDTAQFIRKKIVPYVKLTTWSLDYLEWPDRGSGKTHCCWLTFFLFFCHLVPLYWHLQNRDRCINNNRGKRENLYFWFWGDSVSVLNACHQSKTKKNE